MPTDDTVRHIRSLPLHHQNRRQPRTLRLPILLLAAALVQLHLVLVPAVAEDEAHVEGAHEQHAEPRRLQAQGDHRVAAVLDVLRPAAHYWVGGDRRQEPRTGDGRLGDEGIFDDPLVLEYVDQLWQRLLQAARSSAAAAAPACVILINECILMYFNVSYLLILCT